MDTSAGPRASPQGSSEKESVDFIKLDMWLTNSPDLNPVDYAVWGALRQRVYHRRKFKHCGGTEESDNHRVAAFH